MTPLLAARGEFSWVLPLIFIAFWVLSAIAGSLQKRAKRTEDAKRHEMMDDVRKSMPRPRAPTPRAQQTIRPPAPAPRPIRPVIFQPPPTAPQAPNRREIPRPPTRTVLKPAPVFAARAPVAPTGAKVIAPPAPPQPPVPPLATPTPRLVLTARSLRQQIVISELLQPPLALRQPSEI